VSVETKSKPTTPPVSDAPRASAWMPFRRGGALSITEVKGPSANLLRDALFRRALFAADSVAILAALTLVLETSPQPLRLTWLWLVVAPAIGLTAKLFGLYDRDEALLRKTTFDEVPRLAQLATLAALVAWLADRSLMGAPFNHMDVVHLWLALTSLLIGTRMAARAIARHLSPIERCLFIGDEAAAAEISSKMTCHSDIKATIVTRLDFDKVSPWSAEAVSSTRLQEIRERARELDVHRAIVAPRSADAGEMLDLVRTLKAVGVRVSVLPRLLEVVGSSVEFDDLHGITMMGVRRFDLTRSSSLVKRVFDTSGALLGLLTMAPLMAIIAIAIKLDSRGPVLFRQQRVGRHGSRFGMIKFRTMRTDAELLKPSLVERNDACAGLFKIVDDPRVTRVGRILRQTALDELPQLLNVMKGEMSLVGPRPLVTEEDARIEGWHRRRLELTPGMTGPWQILGATRVSLREMVAMDYLYVANWSLWIDIKILLQTVPHVLGRRGM
jgi:exopolysaccharide biosynthesis polyprenyl glycosylphosphotransferase